MHSASPSSVSPEAEVVSTASFPVKISTLRVADHLSPDAPGVTQMLEESLKVQLGESDMVAADSELSCPEFKPKGADRMESTRISILLFLCSIVNVTFEPD